MNTTPLSQDQHVPFTESFQGSSISYSNLLKDLLTPISKHITEQTSTVQNILDSFDSSEIQKTDLIRFQSSLKLLSKHVTFTLALVQADSEQDVRILKEKFGCNGTEYSQINSKQDLNPIMLSYLLDYIKDKLLPKTEAILEDLLNLKKRKELVSRLEGMKNNIDWIIIMDFRLNLVNEAYLVSITHSKSDIFSLPRSSRPWEALYEHVTVRRVSTQEDIQREVKNFLMGLKAFYGILQTRSLRTDNPQFPSTFSLIQESLKLKKDALKCETLAFLYLINPNDEALRILRIAEDPLISRLAGFRHQYIGYDKYIYVPRQYPIINKDSILQEIQNNTLNKLNHMSLNINKSAGNIRDTLFSQRADTVGVRILAPEPLNLQDNFGEKFGSFIHKVRTLFSKKPEGPVIDLDAIVIHFHGGGFVSGTSAGSKIFLTRWVNNLRMVHFSVDYRRAPEHQYPEILDDVWQAYLWIVNNVPDLFGLRYKKVILTGDSAGGTLAVAVILRLIRAGIQPPDGCLLLYPPLAKITDIGSPSHLTALDDPMTPLSIHKMFSKRYIPKELEKMDDPCLRPLCASDELLELMPPVRVAIGSRDLHHDNCVRFVDRLRRLNRNVKMTIYEDLPHGFYSMSDLTVFEKINNEACDMIRELLSL